METIEECGSTVGLQHLLLKLGWERPEVPLRLTVLINSAITLWRLVDEGAQINGANTLAARFDSSGLLNKNNWCFYTTLIKSLG